MGKTNGKSLRSGNSNFKAKGTGQKPKEKRLKKIEERKKLWSYQVMKKCHNRITKKSASASVFARTGTGFHLMDN